MAKKLIIIDVDTGVDDAQAIMLALSHSSCQLLAITCTSGNTMLNNVCVNTLRVLKACSRLDVPVYRGSETSVLNMPVKRASAHGGDGLGDMVNPEPVDISIIKKEHAVDALIRLVNEHVDEISLVCVAPLTNIMLAQRRDPKFSSKLRELVIMGGNTEGVGNVISAAEFNFYFDPEAAFVVLREFDCPITQVGWEVCQKSWQPWEVYDKWTTGTSKKSEFFKNMTAKHAAFHRSINRPGYAACDVLAMACCLDSNVVQTSRRVHGDVELQGRLTRGQLVCDWNKKLGKEPNIDVVLQLDVEKIREMIDKML